MDARTDGWTYGRQLITIAHPEHSSGELKIVKGEEQLEYKFSKHGVKRGQFFVPFICISLVLQPFNIISIIMRQVGAHNVPANIR